MPLAGGANVPEDAGVQVMRSLSVSFISITVAAAFAGAALAADTASNYPVKPIRMVVPLPPGGTTDLVARIVAQKFSEGLGQQVIVDNRSGAATTLGTALVAKAPPDGYNLLFNSVSIITTVPLYPNLPYDPIKDFAHIGPVGQSFYVMAVHPSLPVKSVKEFIALAKAKPKQIAYASAGAGGITHLAVELFIANTKVELTHVPYKGGAPAIIALVSGEVQAIFNPIAEILPHIRAGNKVRTLAITNPKRAPEIPDVPTLAEAGVPNSEVTTWSGVYAPAGTPQAIVTRLNAEINRMVKLPDVQERMAAAGLVPVGGTPAQLTEYLKSELARWTRIIKNAGIKAQ